MTQPIQEAMAAGGGEGFVREGVLISTFWRSQWFSRTLDVFFRPGQKKIFIARKREFAAGASWSIVLLGRGRKNFH